MYSAVKLFCHRKLLSTLNIFKKPHQHRWSSTTGNVLTDNGIFKAPIWLRHHCGCEKCFNYKTRQRLVIPSQLTGASTVTSVVKIENSKSSLHYEIIWNDNHVSHFDSTWMEEWAGVPLRDESDPQKRPSSEGAHDSNNIDIKANGTPIPSPTSGDMMEMSVNYNEFMSHDDGIKELLRNIRKYGYGLISNAPVSTESTRKAIQRIGDPQSTIFGDVYEFQSDSSHADTAYTSNYIHLHSDTTYFTEPAGLQVFHCLTHDGEGGLNSVVDGFKVAQEIRQENPEQYDILKNTCVPWQYVDVGKHHFRNVAPIFQHHPWKGELECIRYNPHDMALLNTVTNNDMLKFYDSLIHLSNKIEGGPSWFKLNPGTIIFLDNWRMLHGRNDFTGFRKMCGAYISRSDWMSKCRVLLG